MPDRVEDFAGTSRSFTLLIGLKFEFLAPLCIDFGTFHDCGALRSGRRFLFLTNQSTAFCFLCRIFVYPPRKGVPYRICVPRQTKRRSFLIPLSPGQNHSRQGSAPRLRPGKTVKIAGKPACFAAHMPQLSYGITFRKFSANFSLYAKQCRYFRRICRFLRFPPVLSPAGRNQPNSDNTNARRANT